MEFTAPSDDPRNKNAEEVDMNAPREEVFGAATEMEPAAVPCGKPADENEDACRLVVKGLPSGDATKLVADYFGAFTSLRDEPSVKDESVMVVFKSADDVKAAMTWLPDPSSVEIFGHKASVECMAEAVATM